MDPVSAQILATVTVGIGKLFLKIVEYEVNLSETIKDDIRSIQSDFNIMQSFIVTYEHKAKVPLIKELIHQITALSAEGFQFMTDFEKSERSNWYMRRYGFCSWKLMQRNVHSILCRIGNLRVKIRKLHDRIQHIRNLWI